MKKLTAIIITALFALALAACGAKPAEPPASSDTQSPGSQSDAAAIKSKYDKAFDYIQSAIKSDSVQTEKSENDPEYLSCTWVFPDAASEGNLSEDIEIGGQTITIGKTLVKDLAGLGFEMEKPSDTVEPAEIFGILLNKDGKSANIEIHGTDKPQPADELPIYGFTGGAQEFVIPYNYKGLTVASTLQEVLDTMGEPNANIRLTADNMDCSIEIDYVNEKTVGDQVERDSLSVAFSYDAEKSTSVITSFNLSRDYYSADAME